MVFFILIDSCCKLLSGIMKKKYTFLVKKVTRYSDSVKKYPYFELKKEIY